MNTRTTCRMSALALLCAPPFATQARAAADAARTDQATARHWVAARFEAQAAEGQAPLSPAADPPFSFTYAGAPSAELLKDWTLDRQATRLDEQRTRHTLRWTDAGSGLVVRCDAIEYHDFPTIEWTLHFTNSGAANTPILADIHALDIRLERGAGDVLATSSAADEFVLNHHVGSPCAPYDYQPLRTALPPDAARRITTSGGRGSNSDWPYFNIEWPGQGVIAVIGWPGQWAAEFTRDAARSLRVRAGQELTRLTLHPGEEIRAPLIVLQFWTGDRIRAQNLFRRWMLAHNVPRPGGKALAPMLFGCSSHFTNEMVDGNEANQLQFIDRYLEERLPIDCWWMDAGWYVCDGNWGKTGTWEVDAERFPRGLRAISDHARAHGIKTIVWFEPERVAPGTWLARTHPEWILGGAAGGLLDLGNAEARQWLTDRVDALITEQGIDIYRQDFNIDPLEFWRSNDHPDRQGMTEIRHVTGYLAFWDELLRRHPGLIIDSCASGGRRNDLETMRRAVPLWRTDWRLDPLGTQCHTYGISFWLPLSGTGTGVCAAYDFRSNMTPLLNCIWDVRDKDLDYALLRRMTAQFRQVADCYLGDYYPLTAYSLEEDAWLAWQFDRPDLGKGMVQAFRRKASIDTTALLPLRGLEPDARYSVRDLDAPEAAIVSGRDLMERGISVVIAERPAAALIAYERSRSALLPGDSEDAVPGVPEELDAPRCPDFRSSTPEAAVFGHGTVASR